MGGPSALITQVHSVSVSCLLSDLCAVSDPVSLFRCFNVTAPSFPVLTSNRASVFTKKGSNGLKRKQSHGTLGIWDLGSFIWYQCVMNLCWQASDYYLEVDKMAQ